MYSPQPYTTTRIFVGSSQVYRVERIYVDGSGFLASVDEVGNKISQRASFDGYLQGDSLSTIQLPYCQLKQLSISRPSEGIVVMTLVSKVPPIKNQEILPLPLSQDEGHCQCSWELKAADVEKILCALKQRKLVQQHSLT